MPPSLLSVSRSQQRAWCLVAQRPDLFRLERCRWSGRCREWVRPRARLTDTLPQQIAANPSGATAEGGESRKGWSALPTRAGRRNRAGRFFASISGFPKMWRHYLRILDRDMGQGSFGPGSALWHLFEQKKRGDACPVLTQNTLHNAPRLVSLGPVYPVGCGPEGMGSLPHPTS